MIKDIMDYEGPIQEFFMVKQVNKVIGNNGSAYLSLTLQDNSGTIDAKMWQITEDDITIATAGSIIGVIGSVQSYKGHPQIRINELFAPSQKDIDLEKYIPTAPTPIEDMENELANDIDMINDDELYDLTKSLINDNYEAYTTYPAATTIHHAYLGGLLYHSLSICRNAIQIQKNYSFLSLDYLIAGSLLHDIGKIKELSGYMATSYTNEGNLLGHISIGATMIHDKGVELKIDNEKLTVLTHMILAHHGEPDFGSPKVPLTAEAYVLHALDDLDAKMEVLNEAYKTTEEGNFTAKLLGLGNLAYYKPHKLS